MAAFEKSIPAADLSVFAKLVSAGAGAGEIEQSVREMVGDLGFITLAKINQGPLVSRLGKSKKITTYLIGNPVLANRMYEEDPSTGLYAPLRVALYEDYAGVTHVTYDQPSSLLCQFANANIRDVAQILDQKMSGLAARLSQ